MIAAVSNNCYPQILAFMKDNVQIMTTEPGLLEACRLGNMELVKFFLEYHKPIHAWTLSTCLKKSAESGNRELVQFFIEKGAQVWNYGLEGAAAGGHQHLIDFFISKGATAWDSALYGAAKHGSKDLIEFFIQQGADDMCMGLIGAAVGGHEHLLDYFLQRGAFDFVTAMIDAAQAGQLNTVKRLIASFGDEFNKDDYRHAMCRSTNSRIVNLMARIVGDKLPDTDTESAAEEDAKFIDNHDIYPEDSSEEL